MDLLDMIITSLIYLFDHNATIVNCKKAKSKTPSNLLTIKCLIDLKCTVKLNFDNYYISFIITFEIEDRT